MYGYVTYRSTTEVFVQYSTALSVLPVGASRLQTITGSRVCERRSVCDLLAIVLALVGVSSIVPVLGELPTCTSTSCSRFLLQVR